MKTRKDALLEVTKMIEACGDWLTDYREGHVTQKGIIKKLSEAVIEQLEYKGFDKHGWVEKEEE